MIKPIKQYETNYAECSNKTDMLNKEIYMCEHVDAWAKRPSEDEVNMKNLD